MTERRVSDEDLEHWITECERAGVRAILPCLDLRDSRAEIARLTVVIRLLTERIDTAASGLWVPIEEHERLQVKCEAAEQRIKELEQARDRGTEALGKQNLRVGESEVPHE
jgi:hypothetical protein